MSKTGHNIKEEAILAIDIGGSKLLTGVYNNAGKLIKSKKVLLKGLEGFRIIETVINTSIEVSKNFNIMCIGIAIPGLANTETGVWEYSCFSGLEDINIRKLFNDKFKCPVFIENDANICAYGEKLSGCAQNYSDFIWLTVSNGVGSGIFLNNKLFTGYSNNAGEIGHIKVDNKGELCPCGDKDCLEAYAAGPAISKRFKDRTSISITAKEISELAKQGDKEAIKIFEETGYYLGKALASTVNIINVPLIVIGGGISMVYDLFKDSLYKKLQEDTFKKATKELVVKTTELGYNASLKGAYEYAHYNFSKLKMRELYYE